MGGCCHRSRCRIPSGTLRFRVTRRTPLFKPTLTDEIRTDEAGARSYLIGGNPDYPNDDGFLHRGWKRVEFQSEVGPILKAGGLGFKDMGHYAFVNAHGDATRADYTFTYHKIHGDVLISLHHSSLTWVPPKR